LLGWPIRVIRRDLVPRCGPLGGVYSALKTSRAELLVFLACDMPFVSAGLLRRMRRRLAAGGSGLWVQQQGVVGFPFCLRRLVMPAVEQLLARGEFSLQALARAVGARRLVPSPAEAASLVNINTREDWESVRAWWRRPQRGPAPRQTGPRRRRQGRG
jgi:molybdopterin-guanine dinucleotide biosynthesis protein A